jgi:Transglutaminase-like superfamily
MKLSRKYHRFCQLSDQERRMLVEASAGVLTARIALATLPFRTVHALTRKLKLAMGRYDVLKASEPVAADLVARAVERAGSNLPGVRCLPRALAGSVILARYGHDTKLRIGVRRPTDDAFEAHAWLERDGEILVGGPATDFAAFPSFG